MAIYGLAIGIALLVAVVVGAGALNQKLRLSSSVSNALAATLTRTSTGRGERNRQFSKRDGHSPHEFGSRARQQLHEQDGSLFSRRLPSSSRLFSRRSGRRPVDSAHQRDIALRIQPVNQPSEQAHVEFVKEGLASPGSR